MHPLITIFCPFTRRWALDRWISDLKNVEHDPELTNLCFIIDGDDLFIRNMLRKFAADEGYRSFHAVVNEDHQPNEVRISARRIRIADVKNQSKEIIARTDGEYIIGLEDDTVFARMPSFARLIDPIVKDSSIGFVEGVQCGRWGAKMIGAWQMDDFEFPQHAETAMPAEGYEEITAGGWYGYCTQRQLYLDCEYYASSAQPWGPDVNFGIWLHTRGYKCLIDWQTVFGHEDYGQVLWPEGNLTQVVYNRNRSNGHWDRSDVDKNI